jgi:hypothetical protein
MIVRQLSDANRTWPSHPYPKKCVISMILIVAGSSIENGLQFRNLNPLIRCNSAFGVRHRNAIAGQHEVTWREPPGIRLQKRPIPQTRLEQFRETFALCQELLWSNSNVRNVQTRNVRIVIPGIANHLPQMHFIRSERDDGRQSQRNKKTSSITARLKPFFCHCLSFRREGEVGNGTLNQMCPSCVMRYQHLRDLLGGAALRGSSDDRGGECS